MMSLLSRRLLGVAIATLAATAPARSAEDFSAAERSLFMTNHLADLRPPLTLRYRYAKSGTLEEAFTDKVDVRLRARADGVCCTADADFLGGPRHLALPEVETAEGNPSILYFLERDIREMARLTKGQPNYFRKRIRMAIYGGARIREVSQAYQGKMVAAQEITISPYVDDPMRARFENLVNKQYLFTMSKAVPGGVLAVRTRIDGATPGAAPLLAEEMLLDDATVVAKKP